jgi:glycosyltransferase involved in cell wall biosynthesis
VILVDDGSTDRTVQVAREMGLTVLVHPENRGYGGNQKMCYQEALARGADVVVMIHPDYQYDSRVIPHAVGFLELDICNVVLGNRIRSRQEARSGGMPAYKYIANRFLTSVENFALGQNLGDFHSGFRVYRREVLGHAPGLVEMVSGPCRSDIPV